MSTVGAGAETPVSASAPPASAPPSSAPGRARRLAPLLALAGGVLAAASVVAVRDPNEAGHYPGCPFLATTGFFCPGCGSLRATRALLDGDLAQAWHRNPALLLALPLLFASFVAAWRRAWTGRARAWQVPNWMLRALPVLVLAYWVLRNVPGFDVLGPGR